MEIKLNACANEECKRETAKIDELIKMAEFVMPKKNWSE